VFPILIFRLIKLGITLSAETSLTYFPSAQKMSSISVGQY